MRSDQSGLRLLTTGLDLAASPSTGRYTTGEIRRIRRTARHA